MRCPDEGQLLLYLEEELDAEMSREIEEHLSSCPSCLERLQALKTALAFSNEKVKPLYEESLAAEIYGQERVWKKIKNISEVRKKEGRLMKIRKIAVAAAIVLSLGVVGSIPAVQTAAANLLQVFRVEKVDTIALDINQVEQSLVQGDKTIDIEKFGKIEAVGTGDYTNLNEEDLAGLDFKVKLPADAGDNQRTYSLQKSPTIEITPDVKYVNRLLKELDSQYLLPEAMDKQIFRIKIGDALEIDDTDYSLIQCLSPEVEVPEGVNVNEVTRAIVNLSIWPEDVKRQLQAVDLEHTLLIPDRNAQKVKVNGKNAVLLADQRDKTLIWQDDGMLYILQDYSNGEINLTEIAESLR